MKNYEHQEKGSLEVWNKTEMKSWYPFFCSLLDLTPEDLKDS